MTRLLLLIILSISVFSCSKQKEDIEIGLTGVYSGRYSEVGVSARNGIALAVDQINSKGGLLGRKISITPIDNKNNKETIIKAFEDHISAGRKFIIGPNISHLAHETKIYAARDDILIISPTMSTDALAGIKDSFYRVISVTSLEGEAIADKAESMNLKKAAVVYDISNSEYTEPIYRMFREHFEDSGGSIVYINHVSNSIKENFLQMAENIDSSGADMLFLLTTAIDAASIAQQIRKFDSEMKLFAARWAKTLDIISNGGSAVEGMILTSMFTPKQRTEEYIRFQHDYQNKFSIKPSFISAYAYESVMVLAEAVEKAQSTDVAEVRKAITDIGEFSGLEERFTINQYGDAVRKTSLVKISDGAFEVIDD